MDERLFLALMILGSFLGGFIGAVVALLAVSPC
jgi:hypothetical protein